MREYLGVGRGAGATDMSSYPSSCHSRSEGSRRLRVVGACGRRGGELARIEHMSKSSTEDIITSRRERTLQRRPSLLRTDADAGDGGANERDVAYHTVPNPDVVARHSGCFAARVFVLGSFFIMAGEVIP